MCVCFSDVVYSVEELMGMMLEKAREYAKDFAGEFFFLSPIFFNTVERPRSP
jgi:hypothetical protein